MNYVIAVYNRHTRQFFASKGVHPAKLTESYLDAMKFPNRKEARAERDFIKHYGLPDAMRIAVISCDEYAARLNRFLQDNDQ